MRQDFDCHRIRQILALPRHFASRTNMASQPDENVLRHPGVAGQPEQPCHRLVSHASR